MQRSAKSWMYCIIFIFFSVVSSSVFPMQSPGIKSGEKQIHLCIPISWKNLATNPVKNSKPLGEISSLRWRPTVYLDFYYKLKTGITAISWLIKMAISSISVILNFNLLIWKHATFRRTSGMTLILESHFLYYVIWLNQKEMKNHKFTLLLELFWNQNCTAFL